MKKAISFGSLNIDYVYDVDHFTKEGETQNARGLKIFAGGKGLNQAVALAKSGEPTAMAGCVGMEGLFLRDYLDSAGVDTSLIQVLEGEQSGHAIIQTLPNGDNGIMTYAGANGRVPNSLIERTLDLADAQGILVMQNELGRTAEILKKAKERGLKTAFTPAPMNEAARAVDLEDVDYLFLNRHEAAQLLSAPEEHPAQELLEQTAARNPEMAVILTDGVHGAWYQKGKEVIFQPAFPAETVVDTTGAGDTFAGYFLGALLQNDSVQKALEEAAMASSLCVQKPGASASIPSAKDVEAALEKRKNSQNQK